MLQIRHRCNFKGSERAILIAGDGVDVADLRSFFSKWDGSNVDLIALFSSMRKIYVDGIISFHICKNDLNSNIAINGSNVEWSISNEELFNIIERIDNLLKLCVGGHQYLNDDDGSIDVILAKNEY